MTSLATRHSPLATSRTVTVAALQTSYGEDMQANIDKTIGLIRQAAARGAQVILPSELFQGPYFCVTQEEHWFASAYPWREHPAVVQLQPVAKELGVVIPVSIFEKEGPHYFNSMVMLDADGEALGVYRKSHIPDGPGYQEKYYFRPATPASRSGARASAASASASAGTSGIPKAPAPWRCRGLTS